MGYILTKHSDQGGHNFEWRVKPTQIILVPKFNLAWVRF